MKTKAILIISLLTLSMVSVSCNNDDEKDLQENIAPDNTDVTGNPNAISPNENLNPNNYTWVEAFKFNEDDVLFNDLERPLTFTLSVKDEYKDIVGDVTDWHFFARYDFDRELWSVRDEVDPWKQVEVVTFSDEMDLGWGFARRVEKGPGEMPELVVESIPDFWNYAYGAYTTIVVFGMIDGQTAYTGTVKVKKIGLAASGSPYEAYRIVGHDKAINPEGEDFYIDVELVPCEFIDDLKTPDQFDPFVYWGEGAAFPRIEAPYIAPGVVDIGWYSMTRENATSQPRYHITFKKNDTGVVRKILLRILGGVYGGNQEIDLGFWPSYMVCSGDVLFEQPSL